MTEFMLDEACEFLVLRSDGDCRWVSPRRFQRERWAAKRADPGRWNAMGSLTTCVITSVMRSKDFSSSPLVALTFKTCERDLSIPTQNQESAIPFITHNNKTIFIIIVDIFIYDKTASERGKLKAYEILPEKFVQSLSENSSPAN